MTYCFAWKKDEKVFLVADSVTSSLTNEDFLAGTSSFGEIEGLYSKYWTQETSQKIIKINETTAVAYSCNNEKVALEAIANLSYLDYVSLEEILQGICNSYNVGFELIVVSKVENQNKIYHLKNSSFSEVFDFVEIGSGKSIPYLSSSIKELVKVCKEESGNDAEIHLADIISTIQCMSLKQNFIKNGVGGVYFGLYLDKEIRWCKDFMYHFTDSGVNKQLVSLLCRNDTIFYASSFNETSGYFFEKFIQEKMRENKYILEAMVKTINTVIPNYLIYYDFSSNSRVFVRIDGYSASKEVKFWIRRRSNEVNYAILSSPVIGEKLEDNSRTDEFIPSTYMLQSPPTPFIYREEFIRNMGIGELVLDLDLIYDLDFNYINFKREAPIKCIVDESVSSYRNIIVIDAHYLDNLIEEKIRFYRQTNIDLDLNLDLDLKLEPIVEQFTRQITSTNFEEYSIYILVNRKLSTYLNQLIQEKWIGKYKNLFIVEDFKDSYLTTNILSIIKDYYSKEEYFHIDKVILFCDHTDVNGILQMVPHSNFEVENIDILLIREINHLTSMDGRFRYVVSDLLIGLMFGLSKEEISYSESLIEEDLLKELE
ncbi:hypothetical protein ACTFO4_25375 [Bacillus cereus group sp. MYBKT14-1]|uniref:hypothetical protein n=1 Tax=unclassified Bacillus cereus group TaxID=2750818 RepID=UPI003F79D922